MNKKQKLAKLKDKMENDMTLPLREGANRLVFGDGDANAEVLLIGEGPGHWEDQKGIPFVGNAGKVLDRFIASVGMKREDVFITNVVNFRPPSNRDPEEAELAAFAKYIDQMIDIIAPKVIVTLGRFSMAKFLPGVKISHVHGKPSKIVWKSREIMVIPMYHPAAALRNGSIMQQASSDFLIVPKVLDEAREMVIEQEKTVEQMELV